MAELEDHPQQTEAMSRPLPGNSGNFLAGLCHAGEDQGKSTYPLDILKTVYGLER